MEIVHLPLWVEYVKALGAPLVALVAASIAGTIAYRQWVTARNKLKLDLFDRRMEIYTAALDVIQWKCSYAKGMEPKEVMRLSSLREKAKWLLSEQVAQHMDTLVRQAYRAMRPKNSDMSDLSKEERLELIRKETEEMRHQYLSDLESLNKLFEPYLGVAH